ncbi:MAG: two-component regulator propeller domain-containing protein [Candidatus Cryptobacteroides sp.]|nr:two-component regulator propeller domain-containing protein [Candidatus Cryptobacteroides sp.]
MKNPGVKTVALLALFLLFTPVVSLAQGGYEDKYNISVANMEKGFPSNYVDDLFVDSAGFLWIATGGGGLCRFDGTELLSFSYTTTPSVRSNFVRNVVQDGFNRLWVSSEGGLDILDLKHLTHVELDYTLSMKYTLDYFTGYRSALYCMGPSGSAAFDYFHQLVY